MLFKPTDVISKAKIVSEEQKDSKPDAQGIVLDPAENSFADDKTISLTKSIGKIQQGKITHYYSYGNFNLVRLILHLIKQTGPVNVLMTSYSFSQTSIEQLINQKQKGNLLSFRVIIDNRVKTMSPLPFQMLSTSFDYRCSSIHAKVALLWNDSWNITIITSQNATDNPKLERGAIYTDKEVFNFDLNALENEFLRGTT